MVTLTLSCFQATSRSNSAEEKQLTTAGWKADRRSGKADEHKVVFQGEENTDGREGKEGKKAEQRTSYTTDILTAADARREREREEWRREGWRQGQPTNTSYLCVLWLFHISSVCHHQHLLSTQFSFIPQFHLRIPLAYQQRISYLQLILI